MGFFIGEKCVIDQSGVADPCCDCDEGSSTGVLYGFESVGVDDFDVVDFNRGGDLKVLEDG